MVSNRLLASQGNNNPGEILQYYLDWNDVIVFGSHTATTSVIAPCDGMVFFDFSPTGEHPDDNWSSFELNGQKKSVGWHICSFEVVKGTVITCDWSYCAFVPYKKR